MSTTYYSLPSLRQYQPMYAQLKRHTRLSNVYPKPQCHMCGGTGEGCTMCGGFNEMLKDAPSYGAYVKQTNENRAIPEADLRALYNISKGERPGGRTLRYPGPEEAMQQVNDWLGRQNLEQLTVMEVRPGGVQAVEPLEEEPVAARTRQHPQPQPQPQPKKLSKKQQAAKARKAAAEAAKTTEVPEAKEERPAPKQQAEPIAATPEQQAEQIAASALKAEGLEEEDLEEDMGDEEFDTIIQETGNVESQATAPATEQGSVASNTPASSTGTTASPASASGATVESRAPVPVLARPPIVQQQYLRSVHPMIEAYGGPTQVSADQSFDFKLGQCFNLETALGKKYRACVASTARDGDAQMFRLTFMGANLPIFQLQEHMLAYWLRKMSEQDIKLIPVDERRPYELLMHPSNLVEVKSIVV